MGTIVREKKKKKLPLKWQLGVLTIIWVGTIAPAIRAENYLLGGIGTTITMIIAVFLYLRDENIDRKDEIENLKKRMNRMKKGYSIIIGYIILLLIAFFILYFLALKQ